MITGAHSIIYSTNPDADRAFLKGVVGLPSVDVGDGWLIFGLPPSEVAVHPSALNDVHELYFMCDDVLALVAAMKKRNVDCGPVQNQGWGLLTQVTLPGGGKLGIYQPRHARPKPMKVGKSSAKSSTRGKTRTAARGSKAKAPAKAKARTKAKAPARRKVTRKPAKPKAKGR